MHRVPRVLASATCLAFFGSCAFAASNDPAKVSSASPEPSSYEAVGNFPGSRPTIDLYGNYLVHGKSSDDVATRLRQPESSLSFFVLSRDSFYAVDMGSHMLPIFKFRGKPVADFSERQYTCHPTENLKVVHLACRSSNGPTYEITYENARGITSFDYLCDVVSFSTCRYVLKSREGFLSARMIKFIESSASSPSP